MYRHGDVLIVPVSGIPEGAEAQKHLILAEGEATGHAHTLVRQKNKTAPVLFKNGQDLYFSAKEGTAVVHQEHARIELPPGSYKIVNQVEYVPGRVPERVRD